MKAAFLRSLFVMAFVPFSAMAQPTSGSVPAGEANTSSCTGCHTIPGYQTSFPRVYRVPQISGQNAKYIEAALNAYKKGERSHPTMRAIAAGLTDQQISALAAYYSARGAQASAGKK